MLQAVKWKASGKFTYRSTDQVFAPASCCYSTQSICGTLWLQKWSLRPHALAPTETAGVYERSFCRHEEQRYSGTKWRQCDHFRSMFWLYCTNVLLSVKNRAWHVRNCVCGGLMETESLRWPSHCQTRPQAKSFSSGEGPFCSLMSNNG